MKKTGIILIRVGVVLVLAALGIVLMNFPALIGRRPAAARAIPGQWVFTDSVPAVVGAAVPESLALVRALARVSDPELDISIVDLGLLDSLSVDSSGNVRVVLVLTTPRCPLRTRIAQDAIAALLPVPGVRRVELRLDHNERWDRSRLTEAGRRRLEDLFGARPDSTR